MDYPCKGQILPARKKEANLYTQISNWQMLVYCAGPYAQTGLISVCISEIDISGQNSNLHWNGLLCCCGSISWLLINTLIDCARLLYSWNSVATKQLTPAVAAWIDCVKREHYFWFIAPDPLRLWRKIGIAFGLCCFFCLCQYPCWKCAIRIDEQGKHQGNVN